MRLPLLAGFAVLTACGSDTPEGVPPNISGYLAPEVAALLDDNGLLPLGLAAEGRPVSAADAVRLATEFIHGQTSYDDRSKDSHTARLQRIDIEHGSIVNFQSLRPDRAYLPKTPYILPDTAREEVLNAYDAHYVVPFYDEEGFQALAAIIPAEAPGFWIDRTASGNAAGPREVQTGRMLSYVGVHASAEYPVPLTPECAVWLVGTATDRRITAAPEPVFPGRPHGPLTLYWKLELNEPVAIVGDETGESSETEVLFVGLDYEPTSDGTGQSVPVPALSRALPEQPTVDSIRVIWGP